MNNITLTVKIERAISELRRGGKLVVSDNYSGISVLLFAAELIDNKTIEQLSNLALSRPNIIVSRNRCNAIGIKNAIGPCSVLINNTWTLNDLLSICMPLTGHLTPKIEGALTESNEGIVSSCILLGTWKILINGLLIEILLMWMCLI